MPNPKRKSSHSTCYDSSFNRNEMFHLKQFINEDLFNEIGLLRALMTRTLKKMNAVSKSLTFQDYLAALNAFSHASARIAHLVQVQYTIFPPLEQLTAMLHDVQATLLENLNQAAEGYEEQGEPVPAYLESIQDEVFRSVMGMGHPSQSPWNLKSSQEIAAEACRDQDPGQPGEPYG